MLDQERGYRRGDGFLLSDVEGAELPDCCTGKVMSILKH